MTWVVVSDPVPGGATILGGGLGRDSQIATRGEQRSGTRLAGVRGAQLRGVPRLLRVPAARQARGRVHGAPEQSGPVRAAAVARRGDVRAGKLRRVAECRASRSRRDAAGCARSIRASRDGAASALALFAIGTAAPGAAVVRRGQGGASPVRRHARRSPRHADPDRSRRQGGAAPGVDAARRDVAGVADRDRPERGQALLGARRRRLAGGGDERLGQPLEHANARRVDADDAARRPASTRAWRGRRGGRSIGQKLGQAVTATQLERAWKKSEILEAYLNSVPFRGEIVGIEALAQTLFAKHPSGLDAHEAAIAAALVRSPNAKRRRRRRARLRRARSCSALDCVGVKGLAESALAAARRHAARRAARAALRAPRDRSRAARRVQASPLDARLQRFAVTQLRRQLAELAGRNVEDGAVVVLDNASGEVLAWVGSSGDLSGAARGRRRARAAPAGLDAEAVRLRARLREAADHAGDAHRRFAGADRDRRRPVPAAELRPRVEGIRQRAHRARREPQRAGGPGRRDGRHRRAARTPQRARPRPAGKRAAGTARRSRSAAPTSRCSG